MPQLMADQRWIGDHGIGRFAREVIARLGDTTPVPTDRPPLHPLDPWLLRRALKRGRPDLYFSPGFNAPAACDTPIAITVHDLIHLDIPEESGSIKRWYYRRIVGPAVRRATAVFTVSEFSKRRIAEHFAIDAGKIVVVYNGVSDAFTPEGNTAHHSDQAHHRHGRYLLYVGNHKPHKNVPALIDAFAHAKLDPDLGLVMTGRPSDTLLAQIKDAGIDSRVRFIEHLTDDELAGWYRGALALICPSRYEGFGMPVLEAFACGTPVVCSNADALSEVAAGAALQADPEDSAAFAQALARITEDEALRSELSAQGLARAAFFSWNNTAKKIHEALNP
ncbi:MAG: glycosyltransferase family 4 protein [Phycisphaerales bacterium JB063]